LNSFIKNIKQLLFNNSSVANEELNEICEKCNKICYAKRFQQNFKNWTSGNSDIDKLIQDTQLLEHSSRKKMRKILKSYLMTNFMILNIL